MDKDGLVYVRQCKKLGNDIEQLQAELASYRWIPVSERLPDDEVEVLALFISDGEPTIRQVDYIDTQHKWRNTCGDTIVIPPTHWKPIILPKD